MEKKLFGIKEIVREKQMFLKPDQIFTLFVEIVFPNKLSINYLDFLHKLPNLKNIPEQEKVLMLCNSCFFLTAFIREF